MTRGTADLVEHAFTRHHLRRNPAAGRRFRRAHEIGEREHILSIVFRLAQQVILRAVAHEAPARRVFLGKQRTRDSHLVEVRIRGEGLKACVLIFPAESSEACVAVALEDRDHQRRPAKLGGLRVPDREQSRIGDRFDVARTERAG